MRYHHLFLATLVLVSPQLRADPPPLAQIEQATAELERRIETEMKKNGVPGLAVAVVFQNKVILARGFGVREVGQPALVDADTVFQLASVSKPVGATVVAALVGEGLVSWDSRISELDPSFEMFDPWVTREITLRDLYSHRSGLPDHAGDLLEDIGYSGTEIRRRLRFQPPISSFRSSYAYTNFGLTEAAVAAARATGKSWAEVSEDKLYAPLGMTATSSRYADFIANPNHAAGHIERDGAWIHAKQRQPDAQSPAGGVSSSVNDLTRWMRLQLDGGKFEGKQFIDESALAATHEPVILTQFSPINGLPSFYGLGWGVSYDKQGRLRLNHSGAFSMGAATLVGLVPSASLGIVILTNTAPIGLPEGLAQTFLDEALDGHSSTDWLSLFGKIFAEMAASEASPIASATPPSDPSPASPTSSYVGTYTNDYFGAAEIAERDGQLTIALGPDQTPFPLTHWDRDTFSFVPPDENAVGITGVSFALAPTGQASRFTVEFFDQNGKGTFTRQTTPSAAP